MKLLDAPSVESNNEESEQVKITTTRLPRFEKSGALRLPAHSMTVLRWRQPSTR